MSARHPLPYMFAKANAMLLEDDGRELVLHACERTPWSALAENARPSEGTGAWPTSTPAPRGVRAYLPAAAPPAPPAAPPAPKGTPGNAGVVPGQPPAAGQLTAAQIDAMTPDQYRQHRAALLRG